MIKVSDDLAWCAHPGAVATWVPPVRSGWERRTTAPVRGMLRRRPASTGFYRTVCPEPRCGAWSANLYWPSVPGPILVPAQPGDTDWRDAFGGVTAARAMAALKAITRPMRVRTRTPNSAESEPR